MLHFWGTLKQNLKVFLCRCGLGYTLYPLHTGVVAVSPIKPLGPGSGFGVSSKKEDILSKHKPLFRYPKGSRSWGIQRMFVLFSGTSRSSLVARTRSWFFEKLKVLFS